MTAFGPDSLNQVAQVLANTLSADLKERNAEVELKTLSTYPGFGEILIKLIRNNEVASEIRMAASLALKNFAKENWGGEGTAPLAEEERQNLRAMVLDALFEVILPVPLRRQMSSTIFFMAKVDFPEKWPELIEKIGQCLVVTDANFDKLNSALSTLEELTKRYKYEMRSDKLWIEILLVLKTVASPLTELFKQMLEYKPTSTDGSGDSLAYAERVVWLDILLAIVKIFHSLISQDLPEFFEDNLGVWMQSFILLLPLKIASVEQNADDSEANSLDKLKCTICDVATLFSQRYEECFLPFTEEFIRSTWNLLVETDGRIRFDSMVNAALGFLSAITQRPQYKHYFQGEGVLKAICDNVIIKNLILRPEDMEMYEHEPFEFLKRDIEGSDLETRRRGATDFVRALCKQFEAQIFEILSSTIGTFLEDYRQNPVQNIVKKDAVYFLVSAMASKSTTARHGATSTSQLINVSDFYESHVRMDLLEGSPNDSPVLRSDAIKYLVLFRNQLKPELILEVFCGKNNQKEHSILRLFGSQHILLHHYLAYGIERLLLLKDANNQPLFNDANIPVAGLIDSLFSCFSNVTAYHTHYIMKALMRCFSIINFDVNKTAHIYVENLHKMIIQAIENPFNPLLVHFIFESLCVLIRRAYTKVEGGIDKYVLPILELIIPRDVIDFVPYALQLTALLLDQSKSEREKGLEVNQDQYLNFFPYLLKPDVWTRTANIPAIMLVFESFIVSFPQVVFGAQYLDQILGVFQRLIGSKAHDGHGFRLAIAILPYIDKIDNLTSRDILLKMLNRQHQLKTSKYTKQFVFFLFRYAYLKGGLALATALESLQTGLFTMLLEKIMIPEMKIMPQTTIYEEKRLVVIGVVAILSDMAQNLGDLANQLVQSSLAIIDAISKPAVANQENQSTEASPAIDEMEQYVDEANEMEYADQYCRLSYAQHKDMVGKEVVDLRGYLSQAVARLQNVN